MRLLRVPMAETKLPGFFDVARLDFRALIPCGHAARRANHREFRANAFQPQQFSPRSDRHAMLLRNAHVLQPRLSKRNAQFQFCSG